MGWSVSPDETRSDIIQELIREWSTERAGQKVTCKTLAHTVRGNALWQVCVVVVTETGEEIDRYIALALLCGSAKGGGGYKGMTESCGPYTYSCPLAYLDMVPKVANEKWRHGVKLYHEKRSRKLTVGTTYKLVQGCKPPEITITDLKPLRGTYQGTLYRINRRHLAEGDIGPAPLDDEDRFLLAHKDDYIVQTAWGDWHGGVPEGMVGVLARRGGRAREINRYPEDTAYFFIPKAEYDNRGLHFIVDEKKHLRVKDFTPLANITKEVTT